MSDRALTVLVHGSSGSGKSTLAATAPGPRLFLDVEKKSRFLRNKKVKWDPRKGEAPPVDDGTWDMCVVIVNDFEDVTKAHDWLKSGKHPFRSVILDSISELQIQCMDGITGRKLAKTQDWGTLLQRMGGFARDLRDLTANPVNPLEAVVITSMSMDDGEMLRPYLQGQLKHQISYIYDITGYLYVEDVVDPETGEVEEVRRLITRRHPQYEAKENVGGRLPMYVDYPDVSAMLDSIFGPREEPLAAAKS